MTGVERNLLTQFEKISKHIRENSFRTRKRYRWVFIQFLSFIAREFRIQNIRNISQKHVVAYIEYMLSRNYSLPTVYVHLSVIRFYGSKIGYKIPENNILFEKVKEKSKLFTVSKEGVKE